MGPPLYMRSVDRNVAMRRIPVCQYSLKLVFGETDTDFHLGSGRYALCRLHRCTELEH
jgi:hypothetical protein